MRQYLKTSILDGVFFLLGNTPASEFLPSKFRDPPPMKNIRVDPSLRTDSLGLFKYYITTQDYAYILSTTGEKLMPTKLVSP